uniref:Wsv284-like protein n=1 Tax=Metapenaeus ensis nimavirus TaxID=2133794 RepID=A0A401IPC9_9VIRU|nr:wsv284-like protein [Metapenaeus ensis nimavirus]
MIPQNKNLLHSANTFLVYGLCVTVVMVFSVLSICVYLMYGAKSPRKTLILHPGGGGRSKGS